MEKVDNVSFVWSHPLAELPGWRYRERTCLSMQEMEKMRVQSLGQEDLLGEEMATSSSILV